MGGAVSAVVDTVVDTYEEAVDAVVDGTMELHDAVSEGLIGIGQIGSLISSGDIDFDVSMAGFQSNFFSRLSDIYMASLNEVNAARSRISDGLTDVGEVVVATNPVLVQAKALGSFTQVVANMTISVYEGESLEDAYNEGVKKLNEELEKLAKSYAGAINDLVENATGVDLAEHYDQLSSTLDDVWAMREQLAVIALTAAASYFGGPLGAMAMQAVLDEYYGQDSLFDKLARGEIDGDMLMTVALAVVPGGDVVSTLSTAYTTYNMVMEYKALAEALLAGDYSSLKDLAIRAALSYAGELGVSADFADSLNEYYAMYQKHQALGDALMSGDLDSAKAAVQGEIQNYVLGELNSVVSVDLNNLYQENQALADALLSGDMDEVREEAIKAGKSYLVSEIENSGIYTDVIAQKNKFESFMSDEVGDLQNTLTETRNEYAAVAQENIAEVEALKDSMDASVRQQFSEFSTQIDNIQSGLVTDLTDGFQIAASEAVTNFNNLQNSIDSLDYKLSNIKASIEADIDVLSADFQGQLSEFKNTIAELESYIANSALDGISVLNIPSYEDMLRSSKNSINEIKNGLSEVNVAVVEFDVISQSLLANNYAELKNAALRTANLYLSDFDVSEVLQSSFATYYALYEKYQIRGDSVLNELHEAKSSLTSEINNYYIEIFADVPSGSEFYNELSAQRNKIELLISDNEEELSSTLQTQKEEYETLVNDAMSAIISKANQAANNVSSQLSDFNSELSDIRSEISEDLQDEFDSAVLQIRNNFALMQNNLENFASDLVAIQEVISRLGLSALVLEEKLSSVANELAESIDFISDISLSKILSSVGYMVDYQIDLSTHEEVLASYQNSLSEINEVIVAEISGTMENAILDAIEIPDDIPGWDEIYKDFISSKAKAAAEDMLDAGDFSDINLSNKIDKIADSFNKIEVVVSGDEAGRLVASNFNVDSESGSWLFGYIGNDELIGSINHDVLDGGDDEDILNGGLGNDVLKGGIGNDILISGEGNDTLIGGEGTDRFILSASANSTDVISDYVQGEVIDLRDVDGVSSMDDMIITQDGSNTIVRLANNQRFIIENFNKEDLREGDFRFGSMGMERGSAVIGNNGTDDDDVIYVEANYSVKDAFAPNSNYAVNNNNFNYKVADINGDGKDDFVHFVNSGKGYIHTWISKGDGTYDVRDKFTPNSNYAVNNNNFNYKVVDVNGDGKDDLVHFVNSGNGYIHTWISNGDGTYDVKDKFTPSSGYAVYNNNFNYKVADVNGDGKDDFIHFVNSGKGYTHTWISKGDGTYDVKAAFTPNSNYAVNNNNFNYKVADVNGDGKDDIVHFVNLGKGYIHTWISNGDGTYDVKGAFTPNSNYAVNNNNFNYKVADVNGDGKDDFVHFVDSGKGYIHTWISNGDGTYDVKEAFAPNSNYAVNNNNFNYKVVDVNGDGKDDLVHFVDSGNGYIHTWISNGDGTYDVQRAFEPSANYAVNNNGFNYKIADVDGDGKDDFVHFVNSGKGYVHAWMSNGTGGQQLHAGLGDDEVYGESGDDILYGDAGDDTLLGGVGHDELYGGIGDDIIDGGDGYDEIYGGYGADIVRGEEGNDFIEGGDGDDLLNGGSGDDKIYGGSDNDTLSAGEGNNILTGGDGNDHFVITKNQDRTDIITDYQQGEVIDLQDVSDVIGLEQVTITQEGDDTILKLFDNQRIILKNFNQVNLRNEDIVFNDFGFAPEGQYDFAVKQVEFTKSKPLSDGNWMQTDYGKYISGDFDGDGFDDVISFDRDASGTSTSTWLAMSNGDGSFSKSNQFADGNWRQGTASSYLSGDFDGDGFDDIISLDYGGNAAPLIWMAKSQGDGSFIKEDVPFLDNNIWLKGSASRYVSGDFNGDGLADIISMDYGSRHETYSWMATSNGDGTFAKSNPFSDNSIWLKGSASQYVTGDFNGDGFDDVISMDYGSNYESYSWMAISNGDGTFTKSNPLSNANIWQRNVLSKYVTGDYNGDGLDDIMAFNGTSGGKSEFSWLALANGDGTFTKARTLSDGNWNQAAYSLSNYVAGDFDGDGLDDVMALSKYSSGTSDWSWMALSQDQGAVYGDEIMQGDFVTPFIADDMIINNSYAWNKIGDFNGDGVDDLMAIWSARDSGDDYAYINYGNSDGTFSEAVLVDNMHIDSSGGWWNEVGDYNGDGIDDILAISKATGSVNQDSGGYINYGREDGTFLTATYTEGMNLNRNSAWNNVGDFNGDGIDDVMAVWAATGRTDGSSGVYINYGNAEGGFDTPIYSGNMNINKTSGWNYVGDFNGDGIDDFMAAWSGAGYNDQRATAYVHYGSSQGIFSGPVLVENINLNRNYNWNRIGDFNGDGIDDIMAVWAATSRENGTSGVYINYGNSEGTFDAPVYVDDMNINGNHVWDHVGDFDGDGHDDLMGIWSATGRTDNSSKVYMNLSSSSNQHFEFGDENDSLFGGLGSDYLAGGGGNDKLSGGQDNDRIYGEDGNDSLYGDEGHDSLEGGNGYDLLYGGYGNDILNGGEHNDSLYGGEGNDYLSGGNHNDLIYGDDGNDVLSGGAHRDTLYGGAGNDSLYGGTYNDQLRGGTGDDLLMAEDGDDGLQGEEGNDTLNGWRGTDTLYGGSGDDILDGGLGDDILRGDSGDDLFDYNSLSDSTDSSMDTIMDFEVGLDLIDLSDIEEIDEFSDLSISYSGGNTYVDDLNSNFAIELVGEINLSEDDFIIS